jgi:hypothetical protein
MRGGGASDACGRQWRWARTRGERDDREGEKPVAAVADAGDRVRRQVRLMWESKCGWNWRAEEADG